MQAGFFGTRARFHSLAIAVLTKQPLTSTIVRASEDLKIPVTGRIL